jgi:hypothetical protein
MNAGVTRRISTLQYKADWLRPPPQIETEKGSSNMSNSPTNQEQSQLIELTETQQNPGAARASDFVVADRDGGQRGDTKAERASLLAEADSDAKSKLSEPIQERNEVPQRRYAA